MGSIRSRKAPCRDPRRPRRRAQSRRTHAAISPRQLLRAIYPRGSSSHFLSRRCNKHRHDGCPGEQKPRIVCLQALELGTLPSPRRTPCGPPPLDPKPRNVYGYRPHLAPHVETSPNAAKLLQVVVTPELLGRSGKFLQESENIDPQTRASLRASKISVSSGDCGFLQLINGLAQSRPRANFPHARCPRVWLNIDSLPVRGCRHAERRTSSPSCDHPCSPGRE
jgi:hypothetical protein